jgi:hypothetical protein
VTIEIRFQNDFAIFQQYKRLGLIVLQKAVQTINPIIAPAQFLRIQGCPCAY